MFVNHKIDLSRRQSVGAMVMPQLRKNGLKPEDAQIAMIRVKKAYHLVPRLADSETCCLALGR